MLPFRQGKFFRDFPDFLHRPAGTRTAAGVFALTGGRFFACIKRGISPSVDGGNVAAPRGVGKRVDTCGFYPLNSRFPLFLSLAQIATCDRSEKRERQRSFSTVGEHSVLPCRDIFAVPDTVLLHRRFTLRRARHSSAARFVSALLQTGSTRINCTKCLIRRCRALQRAKELRNTVMLRLR